MTYFMAVFRSLRLCESCGLAKLIHQNLVDYAHAGTGLQPVPERFFLDYQCNKTINPLDPERSCTSSIDLG
jgi:hypothetical protein